LTLPLIDALLTRGEAHLTLADKTNTSNHYDLALDDFNNALRRVKGHGESVANRISNPKIAAVCLLRIAEIHAKRSNQKMAHAHFSEWLRLEGQVEHEWIRELATRVKEEIDKLSLNFTISSTDETAWSYTENVARMRKWLLKRALRHTDHNYSEAARLIGVQRTTLYQWFADNDAPTKRRGRVKTASKRVPNSAPSS
jgi:DNA-binding protein Fis